MYVVQDALVLLLPPPCYLGDIAHLISQLRRQSIKISDARSDFLQSQWHHLN
jgi:hypothetical protein